MRAFAILSVALCAAPGCRFPQAAVNHCGDGWQRDGRSGSVEIIRRPGHPDQLRVREHQWHEYRGPVVSPAAPPGAAPLPLEGAHGVPLQGASPGGSLPHSTPLPQPRPVDRDKPLLLPPVEPAPRPKNGDLPPVPKLPPNFNPALTASLR